MLLAGGAAATLLRTPVLLLPGVLVIGLLAVFIEWRILYYLLFVTLPFSQEIGLPGGLSMDLPSEPLMLVLTACVPLALLLRKASLPRRELLHPIVIILLLMLLWAGVDIFFSVDTTKSVKYLLAKVWYITPFLFGSLLIVRRPAQAWHFAAAYATGACLSVLYVASRHVTKGFSFAEINWALQPYFRNHVIYASLLALLTPFCFYAAKATTHVSKRWLWYIALFILLFGLLTSYTRASILSVPIAALYYLVLRLRLTRVVLVASAITVGGAVFFFISQNNFMLYAPDFEKTVFNGKNFSKHLEATYNMQDVSGMERVYRWVAASRMIATKPLTGSGPSTFYPEYKRFTVKSFRTYVSENPEKSTTHNYFLLQLAEQGLPGFILFVIFISTILLTAENVYHRAEHDPAVRRVVLAATLSLIIIIFHLFLNELIEVDKIGSVFFVCLALLIRAGSWVDDRTRQLGASDEQA
jgi:O-antigen ligase